MAFPLVEMFLTVAGSGKLYQRRTLASLRCVNTEWSCCRDFVVISLTYRHATRATVAGRGAGVIGDEGGRDQVNRRWLWHR